MGGGEIVSTNPRDGVVAIPAGGIFDVVKLLVRNNLTDARDADRLLQEVCLGLPVQGPPVIFDDQHPVVRVVFELRIPTSGPAADDAVAVGANAGDGERDTTINWHRGVTLQSSRGGGRLYIITGSSVVGGVSPFLVALRRRRPFGPQTLVSHVRVKRCQ